MRWGAAAAAASAASLMVHSSAEGARGDALSGAEGRQLLAGSTVSHVETMSRDGRRYVGGVTYTLVSAGEADVAALLDDVDGWRRILPNTRAARTVGRAGGDSLVEITHGSAIVQVSYTMRVHRERDGVRFWMDLARQHDIEDVWGFFRAQPTGEGTTLLTYGILIDMGPGLLRDLFEERIRDAALSVPGRLRGLLLERRSGEVREPLVAGARLRY